MKFNLSEINEVIRARRSITPENYSNRVVHREQLELILTNATWAPTHGMTQPWRFKVFMGQGMKKLQEFIPELYKMKTSPEAFNQGKYDRINVRMQHVSAVVILCMERDKTEKIAELEELQAVACAAQNMMLTCTAYGLGSFWSSPKFIYSQEMKHFLKLSDADKCLGIFYIGYPAGEWPKSHRKPLEYVVEWIEQ